MLIVWNVLLVFILLGFPPLLLALCCSYTSQMRILLAALLAPACPLVVALLLHISNLPITRPSLLMAHGALLLVAVLCFAFRHVRPGWPSLPPIRIGISLLFLLVLLFPWTNLTGIDTYKWQDLATAIRMEQSIPWLVHPISLLGFGPRAYPPLQPVLLASIQIIGDFGVDGGFRILSVMNVILGFTTATLAFRRFAPPGIHHWAALLYVASPVFVRFTHWATGRGLFLALLPVCLYALAPQYTQPRASQQQANRIWTLFAHSGLFLLAAMLLLTSHKVALVAIPLLLATRLCAVPLPKAPWLRIMLLIPFAVLVVLMSTPIGGATLQGVVAKCVWTGISRFSWFLPLATIAWIWPPTHTSSQATAYLQRLFLVSLPLAFDPHMYGALIALPAICLLATHAAYRVWNNTPPRKSFALIGITFILTALVPLAIILHHSRLATPQEIKNAAMFLQQHDPAGPYQIQAPDPIRTRIQAYVSGCPRFTISTADNPTLSLAAIASPPRLLPISGKTFSEWSAWLRQGIRIQGLQVAWYGDPLREYIICTDKQVPPNADLIYTNPSVRIYQRNLAARPQQP